MKVTLEQVARMSQVSIITARRAMRNETCVRSATRDRVKKAAWELGYRTNMAARQLKAGRRHNVGILVACRTSSEDATEIYLSAYARFITRLSDELNAHDHSLMIESASRMVQIDRVKSLLPRLVDDGRIDKLVVLSDMWPEFADQLQRLHIPTIVMDGPDCGLSSVQVNESLTAESLTDRFVAKGHRSIAFCNHPVSRDAEGGPGGYRDTIWPKGYLKSITSHQLIPVPGWDQFDPDIDSAIDRLLALENPPTGIIAYDDQLANVIASKLTRRGYCVPEQISVAGLHSCGIGRFVDPMVTHMSAPLESMAQSVADLLVRDDRLLLDTPRHLLVDPDFFEGQTLVEPPGDVCRDSEL